ncbi:predicted protein [Coccidioides posadasii str. Silveira]|uniref:Predicted protein n=1 Tax=Coccidioides posadasii (strain RMSCC 757 / Silveira) TaxID=443226 RepID=E9DHZ7_COCPS|nr:predicted protein [Coccidioides posadasii str. Silveira]
MASPKLNGISFTCARCLFLASCRFLRARRDSFCEITAPTKCNQKPMFDEPRRDTSQHLAHIGPPSLPLSKLVLHMITLHIPIHTNIESTRLLGDGAYDINLICERSLWLKRPKENWRSLPRLGPRPQLS